MLKYIMQLTVILLLLIACGKNTESDEQNLEESELKDADTTKLNTTAAENPDELFLMRYKFEKGKSFRYKMTVTSGSQQSMIIDSSVSQYLSQTSTYLINFTTIEVDSEDVAELECTIKSVKLNIDANGEKLSYYSANADSSSRLKFAEYEAYINNPFHVRVTNYGSILEIFKADKISNTFLTIRGLTDSVTVDEKIQIRDDLVKNILKPLLAQIIREVPEHKVRKDSSWTYSRTTLPILIFQVQYQNLYKIENLEMFNDEKLAVIDGTILTTVEGNTKYSEQGVNYDFDKPKSTAGGKIYFNLSKGLVQKSETQTRLENSFRMEMPSPQGMRKGSRYEIVTNKSILELL